MINLFLPDRSRCVRILGKLENIRVVKLCQFQGIAKASQVAPTVEMTASDNPALQNQLPDPTIFCTAFKKNRFYMVRRLQDNVTHFIVQRRAASEQHVMCIVYWAKIV